MIFFPLLFLLLQLVLPVFAKGFQLVGLAWWGDNQACWLLELLLKLARLVRILKCWRSVRGGLVNLVNALTAMPSYSFRLWFMLKQILSLYLHLFRLLDQGLRLSTLVLLRNIRFGGHVGERLISVCSLRGSLTIRTIHLYFEAYLN